MAEPVDREQVPRRETFRRGLGFGVLSFGSIALVGLASTVLTARLYGAHVIGQFALAAAAVAIVSGFSTVREQAALVRRLAVLAPRDPRVTALFAVVLGFSAALTAAVVVLSAPVVVTLYRGPLDHPELVAPTLAGVGGYLLLANTTWNLDVVFSSFRAGQELFWIRLTQNVAFLVAAVALYEVDESVWCLVAALQISFAVGLVHRLVLLPRYMRLTVSREEVRVATRELPDMLRFGAKILPVGMADGASDTIGVYLLAGAASTSDIGGYDRANRFVQRFADLNYRIDEMLLPTLVERRDSADETGYDRALVDTMRYAAAGALLLAAAGGGAAASVMSLFGPDFEAFGATLAILLLAPPFGLVASVQRTSAFADDWPGTASVIAIGRLVLTVAATIPLVRWQGAEGVALGLLGGLVFDALVFTVMVSRRLHRPLSAYWCPRQALAMVAAYGAGFGAARVVDDGLDGAAGLLAGMGAGALAYVVVLAAAGGLVRRDRERLAAVAQAGRRALSRA
jgi:O-antigen/teichoic acid export membrane protein